MKKRRVGLVSVVLMLTILLLSVLGCTEGIEAPTATPESTKEPGATGTRPEVIHTAQEIEEELILWLDLGYVAHCARDPDCNPDPVAVLHMRTELPSALRASKWWYEDPEFPILNGWKWTITAAVEVPVKFPYGSSEPYTWDYAMDGGSYITKPVFLSWWAFDEAPTIPAAENEDTRTYRRWLIGESYFRPTDQMMLDWFRQGTHH